MRTLYCHCAYARVVPPQTKNAVLAHIEASARDVECVPDLCEMSARRDPRLNAIADGSPVTIVACYDRAVRGLFKAAGAPLPSDGVTVLNMRTEAPEAIIEALETTAPETAAPVQRDSTAQVAADPAPGAWKPWFPVIDYSRCTNCMQCLSFCLFDVYGVSTERQIQVQNPTNCKTECPACSRVCPEVAIMFPKYRHAPINGDVVSADDVRREAMKVDISALLGGDVYSMLRDRSAKAKSRFSKERDEERALRERQTCLVKLQKQMDVPPEVLASLPSVDEIRARAEAAAARAKAALEGGTLAALEGGTLVPPAGAAEAAPSSQGGD